MASVDDVVAAILEITGRVDTFKLQKLVYYCQAWHLVWVGEPLFPEPIQAWAGGPVVPALYERHRGRYSISEWPEGNASELVESERGTVSSVVNAYQKLSGRQLSQLTHSEEPWLVARGTLGPGARGSSVIEPGSMQEYYSGIDQDPGATLVEDLVPAEADEPF